MHAVRTISTNVARSVICLSVC